MFCFVAQALTFLSWGSNLCNTYECTWSSGTGMNITASLMWIWAGNMIKSFPEALPPRGRGRRKDPLYDDDDDDYDDYDDYDERSPYLNPHGSHDVYEDEYDEDGDEHVDFQNDPHGHNREYDDRDGYYDDGYDDGYSHDQSYPTAEHEDGHRPEGYVDYDGDHNDRDSPHDGYQGEHEPYKGIDYGPGDPNDPDYHDPAFPRSEYSTDYEDPEPLGPDGRPLSERRHQDNEFEPNQEFQGAWQGNSVEKEEFNPDSSSNVFQSSEGNSRVQQDLSPEELEFLGQGHNVVHPGEAADSVHDYDDGRDHEYNRR